jgi:threonine dehydratase
MITLSDIQAARTRISPYILPTPLLRIPALDAALGCRVYLKLESLQRTGSFKLRGALNALLCLTDAQRTRGVVASSSGNHAQGVACAGQLLGVDVTIVMPTNCNPTKLAGVKSYGARVLLEGTLSTERDAKAAQLVAEEGRVEIHPYDNPYVKAGQGTLVLEALEQCPDLDVFVAPVGGGGLVCGVAAAAKGLKPDIRVVGVEPAGAARYTRSREAGKPITLENVDTIADGTRTSRAAPSSLEIMDALGVELATAEDSAIRAAMRLMVSGARQVAEPSSVLPIAAALSGRLDIGPEDAVCFVISGGNNDLKLLSEILAKTS